MAKKPKPKARKGKTAGRPSERLVITDPAAALAKLLKIAK